MIFDRLARETVADRTDLGRTSSRMFGLPPAGVPVDEHSALKFGAVFGCVKVISESLMILPWRVLETVNGSREAAPDHPVDPLLKSRPNPEIPAYSFVSTLTAHALLQGNGYAEIERDRAGRPLAMWQLDPARVNLERDSLGQLYYKVRNDQAQDSQVPPEDMFHLRGPSYDGLTGHSIVSLARDAISAGLAAERFGSTFSATVRFQVGSSSILKALNSRHSILIRSRIFMSHGKNASRGRPRATRSCTWIPGCNTRS